MLRGREKSVYYTESFNWKDKLQGIETIEDWHKIAGEYVNYMARKGAGKHRYIAMQILQSYPIKAEL